MKARLFVSLGSLFAVFPFYLLNLFRPNPIGLLGFQIQGPIVALMISIAWVVGNAALYVSWASLRRRTAVVTIPEGIALSAPEDVVEAEESAGMSLLAFDAMTEDDDGLPSIDPALAEQLVPEGAEEDADKYADEPEAPISNADPMEGWASSESRSALQLVEEDENDTDPDQGDVRDTLTGLGVPTPPPPKPDPGNVAYLIGELERALRMDPKSASRSDCMRVAAYEDTAPVNAEAAMAQWPMGALLPASWQDPAHLADA